MKNSNLIFGLMAAFGKEEYSSSDLTHLLAPFNVTESSLRTNLSRMTSRGLLKSRREGKWSYYSFSEKGVAIRSNVALSFRSLDWSTWDNSWWGVLFSVPKMEESERYKIRKKLLAYRFAFLYPGFWVRPFSEKENSKVHLEHIFAPSHCKLIRFHYLSNMSIDEVSQLWHLTDINNDFKIGLKTLEVKREQLNIYSPKQALVEKMIVGEKIINILFKNPLLPDMFLPNDWKGEELRHQFFEWDKEVMEISRLYWEKIIN